MCLPVAVLVLYDVLFWKDVFTNSALFGLLRLVVCSIIFRSQSSRPAMSSEMPLVNLEFHIGKTQRHLDNPVFNLIWQPPLWTMNESCASQKPQTSLIQLEELYLSGSSHSIPAHKNRNTSCAMPGQREAFLSGFTASLWIPGAKLRIMAFTSHHLISGLREASIQGAFRAASRCRGATLSAKDKHGEGINLNKRPNSLTIREQIPFSILINCLSKSDAFWFVISPFLLSSRQKKTAKVASGIGLLLSSLVYNRLVIWCVVVGLLPTV